MNAAIKGIVFDFGGVISRQPIPSDMEPVLSKSGLTWDQQWEGFAKYRPQYDRNDYSCEEMFRRILVDNDLPYDDAILKEFATLDSQSWANPNPGMLDLMKVIKNQGYKIGILTNMSTDFADNWFFPRFPEQIALADAVIVSGYAGIIKPDPKIFQLMEEKLLLSPSELFFTDDSERNCQGARDCGWTAASFTTPDVLKALF